MNQPTIRHHFKSADPIIYQAMKGIDFNHWLKSPTDNQPNDYFTALCRSIISQQLSGKAATTIYTRFIDLFPHKTVTPQQAHSIPDQTLRDAGLSWAKVAYIKDLAQQTKNGTLTLHNIQDLDDKEVILRLTKIKGVGEWTAEMFLMFTLLRPDIFSHGDLGLRRGIEKLYNLSNPSTKTIEKIITPWSPYKTYASITLWHSLNS